MPPAPGRRAGTRPTAAVGSPGRPHRSPKQILRAHFRADADPVPDEACRALRVRILGGPCNAALRSLFRDQRSPRGISRNRLAAGLWCRGRSWPLRLDRSGAGQAPRGSSRGPFPAGNHAEV